MRNSLSSVQLINFPKVEDPRGNLSFMENDSHLPFHIRKTHWIYDVPGGEIRGGHAFRKQEEIIIALSGSFDVVVTDGTSHKTISLNRSYYGLYIPAGIWRHMENFSTNSCALVLSSAIYSEADYIRSFKDYKNE